MYLLYPLQNKVWSRKLADEFDRAEVSGNEEVGEEFFSNSIRKIDLLIFLFIFSVV
jgi:hypothetical protein